MSIEASARTWVQSVTAGFLCFSAAVSLAVAAAHPPAPPETKPNLSSGYIPPGMHEAQSGEDVGPGSDEALLVTSPQPE